MRPALAGAMMLAVSHARMSAETFGCRAEAVAWRATFYPTGIAHSIIYGDATEPTPWRAAQRAAWQALNDPRAAA